MSDLFSSVVRDLNVYVASESNDSVVVISPDGKHCRTVLGESDGIYKRWQSALIK